MNLSAENIVKIRDLVRSGYPLKTRDAKDLQGHNDHLVELLEARGRLMLGVEIERDQLKAENGAAQTLIGSVVIAAGARLGKDLVEVIELLRKNAERYRWLREARHGCIEVVEWIGPHATGMTGEDLDALLDAAIGKGEQS